LEISGATEFVYNARMDEWSDELHAVFQQLSAAANRPDYDAAFVARAGVKLDRALFPLLSRIGVTGPVSTGELAGAVGRDHSTVSRQVAKLEALGLVQRSPVAGDGRVRLLRPTAAGQAMLDEFRIARRAMMREHFADWTQNERETLLRLLRKAFGPAGALEP
jgi:DNA-binding MarR family transcriptional regulator